jgi:hypothetical protein
MNRIVHFKGNRAERHACASSNICRMPYAITVWTPAGAQKMDTHRIVDHFSTLKNDPIAVEKMDTFVDRRPWGHFFA